jgi:DNA-directed RNA polymerase specialized sigma24 family protein
MLAGFVLELDQPKRDVVLLHYFEGVSSVSIGNRLASTTARCGGGSRKRSTSCATA